MAVAAGTILCESGGHALAQDFPSESFWEYCCDCQSYWPSDIAQSGKARDECLVCDRPVARRYLCDRCKLISFESDEPAKRKAYTVALGGAVEPNCPGCMSRPSVKPRVHECDGIAAAFVTARETCPFCGESISDPPSFPSSVADYLSRVTARKIEASFEPLTDLLVTAQGGEFVLVPGFNGSAPSIVVPRAPRFESRADYRAYESLYLCVDDAAAGEVWVIHPAVVEQAEGGWRLREAGRIEIRRDALALGPAPAPSDMAASPAAPATAGFCPRCGLLGGADKQFCGGCGHDFGAGPAAKAKMPLATASEDLVAADPFADEPPLAEPRGDAESTVADSLPPARGRRRGALVLLVAVAALFVLVAAVALNSGTSLESKLDNAITRGNLISPQGESAYDYYQQLKSRGAGPGALARFDGRLVPLLTSGPQQMIAEFAKPGGSELAVPQWDDACKQLSWASQIRPDDNSLAARAAYCCGRVAYLNDRKDETLAEWQRASELDKSWAVAVNGVGLIYNERKEYERARTYLREAIDREPSWAVPYNNLGTSYYFRRDYDNAETYYQKAVERAPNWARPHAWLGDVAKYRRDYARAAQEYEIVLNPSSIGTAKMNLNEIRQKLEEARRLAEQNKR